MSGQRPEGRRAIWLALSDNMTMRMFLSTDFVDRVGELCDEQGLDLVVLTPQRAPELANNAVEIVHISLADRAGSLWERSRIRSGLRTYVARSANFRFDEINGFRKHRRKRRIDKTMMHTHPDLLTPEDRRPGYLGVPASRSRTILKGLNIVRRSPVLAGSGKMRRALEEHPPVILLAASCQATQTVDALRSLQGQDIPKIAFVSSWDNLTLRGPVIEGFDEYWVWNRVVASELEELHGIDPGRIAVVGCPLFDIHREDAPAYGESILADELDIPATASLVLYAAETRRLGQGEPSVAQHMLEKMKAGTYGLKDGVLVIRSHPSDRGFAERFSGLASDPCVRLYHTPRPSPFDIAAQRRDVSILSGMIAKSEVLICGPGTVALDAACQDKPVINVRFDGNVTLPEPLSAQAHYDSDHYERFLGMRSTEVVESFHDLDRAIVATIADPERRAEGRARVREAYAAWDSIGSASDALVGRMRHLLKAG